MVLTLCHFVASKLGIPSPPAYLSVSQNVDALLKGVNYASGGAGILNDTGLYFVSKTTQDSSYMLKPMKHRSRHKHELIECNLCIGVRH